MRKIPVNLIRREGCDLRFHLALGLALTLVSNEEEKTVLQDRTAHGAAELLALQVVSRQALLLVEIRVGVEGGVAREIKCAAVQLICARLGNDADDSGAIASVLCRVIAGENAELFDRVGIGIQNHSVAQQIVIHAAIEQERHRIRSATCDAEGAGAVIVRIVLGNARLQLGQVQHVAAVQGKIHDRAAGHRLADGRVFGFNVRSQPGNFHDLVQGPYFQAQVHFFLLIDLQSPRPGDQL